MEFETDYDRVKYNWDNNLYKGKVGKHTVQDDIWILLIELSLCNDVINELIEYIKDNKNLSDDVKQLFDKNGIEY